MKWIMKRVYTINEIEDRVFVGMLPGLLLGIVLYIHYWL